MRDETFRNEILALLEEIYGRLAVLENCCQMLELDLQAMRNEP